MQKGVQEQLQLVLLCTSAATTHMKSRAVGAAEESVVLVRVTETESMATVYLRTHSLLFVRGGHIYMCSTGQWPMRSTPI